MEELQNPGADNISSAEQNPPKNPALAFIEKRKIFVILALALVVLIVIACVVFIPQSPERVAEEYCEADFFEDIYKQQSYSAHVLFNKKDEASFFERKSLDYGENIDSLQEYGNVLREIKEEYLLDRYGKYTITFEATLSRDIPLDRLSDYSVYLDKMEKTGSHNRDDIKELKRVTVKMKLEGEERNLRETHEFVLVKLGLSWKVLCEILY